jgi:hypothetical protein
MAGRQKESEIERLNQWFAGLPLARVRGLSSDEIAELSAACSRQRLIGWASTGVLLFGPILLFWRLLGHRHQPGLALILLILVALTPFALFGLFGFLRSYRLRKVLRDGRILVFAGRPRNLDSLDVSQNQLKSAKLWNEAEQWYEVELFAASGAVKAVNGRRMPGSLLSRTYTVARVAPVPRDASPRQLTELERLELTQHINRYRGPSSTSLMATMIGLAAMLGLLVALRHFAALVHLVLAGAMVWNQIYLARKGRPFADKLQRDLDAGVLIDGERLGALKLAVSGMPWVAQGEPSEWRTIAPGDLFVTLPPAAEVARVQASSVRRHNPLG